jgi:hypothetical protein
MTDTEFELFLLESIESNLKAARIMAASYSKFKPNAHFCTDNLTAIIDNGLKVVRMRIEDRSI